MGEHKHKSIELAGNESCRVHACTCGHVRVMSGGLSMNLELPTFLKIAAVIEEAAMKLCASNEFIKPGTQPGATKLH